MNKIKRVKIIWLTWEKQVRNRSMAKELEIPLFELISGHRKFMRYATCVSRTIILLLQEKPSIVICQNPSIVLTFLLLILKFLLDFKLVVDAHFGGIDASNGSKASQGVLDWCNRSADLVIVTNENHAHHVRKLGGVPFVCQDPLPDLSKYRGMGEEIQRKVFLICSYDIDEPFREVFKAAEMLSHEGFSFFVSGDYQKAGIAPHDFPQVNLLGFLPEKEFYRHLFSSQLVIDLTENDDCLVCGAYEALEALKPLILSRKKALQEYFNDGTVFTENNPKDIEAAIRLAYSEKERLTEGSRRWVLKAKNDIKIRMIELKSILENI